jgi:hypothetical protein
MSARRAATLTIPALAAMLALGSCTANTPPPRAALPPVAAPLPPPPPPPAAPPAHWADAPQTPGEWRYGAGETGSSASFGRAGGIAEFTLSCDQASRVVTLWRAGESPQPAYIRVLAETQSRLLDASAGGAKAPGLLASLAANDRLLDAMALSRGRFALETSGLATLILPAWTEVSRVIEDCR